MSKQVIKYKDRADWLQARSNGIGASEAGTILGLNPFETPYQLWRRKKGMDPPKQENFAMRAGHYLEDAVSKFYADESHCHIIKSSTEDFTILSTENPILRVSPDRTFWRLGRKHNDKEKSILECKTTQLQIDPDNIPKHWFCQLQMNLGVGEYRDGALAWLTQGREFGCLDLEFDKDFFEWMSAGITDFWNRYIVGGEEPDAYTPEDVMLKSPKHVPGKTVTANDDILQQLGRLREIKESVSPFDKEKKEIENNLKLFIGDAEGVVDENGNVLATWKAPKPKVVFDQALFESSVPEEKRRKYYHETQPARRLLIK